MAHSALVLIKISANLISALKLVLFMLLCVGVSGTSLVPKSNRQQGAHAYLEVYATNSHFACFLLWIVKSLQNPPPVEVRSQIM